ncbi:zinc-finger-containing protein [Burkholderia gladioli]|uniref:zinc-finger-containing protein n=1 Tax=Burkholderia gladioli TaxID=28095 RepID=UPI001641A4FD|nr:zinc-finger-containing protein [Burkholderia gladioli]
MRVGRPVPTLPQPVCDYCGEKALLARFGDAAYPYRDEHGELWVCPPCDAWIGIFPRSRRHVPLGRLANAELRQAKSDLHTALEPLVAAKMRRDGCNAFEARAKGIRWLATQLGQDPATTLHGFDLETCRAAIALVREFLANRQRGEAADPVDGG